MIRLAEDVVGGVRIPVIEKEKELSAAISVEKIDPVEIWLSRIVQVIEEAREDPEILEQMVEDKKTGG